MPTYTRYLKQNSTTACVVLIREAIFNMRPETDRGIKMIGDNIPKDGDAIAAISSSQTVKCAQRLVSSDFRGKWPKSVK